MGQLGDMGQPADANFSPDETFAATTAEQKARSASGTPKSVHLHIVSETEDNALREISQKIRHQYTGRQITEHVHCPVGSRRQLEQAISKIEAEPGIVVYSLSSQKLADQLELFCKKKNVPCFAGPKATSKKGSKPPRRLRAVMLSLLAVVLIWAIGTKGLLAYLVDANSVPASNLSTMSSAALVDAAAAELSPINRRVSEQLEAENPASSGPDETSNRSWELNPADAESLLEIQSQLELALRKDPLNARALSLLGQVVQLQGDDQRTEQIMQAAANRSLHNYYPAYLMLVKSYEDQDFKAAVRYADALMRASGRNVGAVVRILAKMAETPEGSAELERVLKTNPPWRAGFFRQLKKHITDARTPLNLFLALENTAAAPTPGERADYIRFLVERRLYDVAYYVWLQFLPDEQTSGLGDLFNGNFEVTPTGIPFDWNFGNQAGVIVEVTNHPDSDGHALFMKLGPGRVNLGDIEQLVVLPAGKYRFQGLSKIDLLSKKGLFWQVSCIGTPKAKTKSEPIGRGPTIEGRDLAWNSFSFDFTVPNIDCPAQSVRLSSAARAASDQFMSGSVWFDDLEITREAADQPQL